MTVAQVISICALLYVSMTEAGASPGSSWFWFVYFVTLLACVGAYLRGQVVALRWASDYLDAMIEEKS